MLTKKLNLKWALEKNLPKDRVKDFFLDYDEAYKRMRNPSEKHYQDYKNLFFEYDKYMKRKDIK